MLRYISTQIIQISESKLYEFDSSNQRNQPATLLLCFDRFDVVFFCPSLGQYVVPYLDLLAVIGNLLLICDLEISD